MTTKNTDKEFEEKELTQDELENTDEETREQGESEERVFKEKEEKLEKLGQEEEAYKVQLMRLQAEFQNFKKRTEREKFELSSFIKIEFIKRFLPVLDDIFRLKENLESDEKTLKEALKLVFPKVEKFLSDEKISTIASEGDDFDPNLHEALMQLPVDSDEKDDKVLSVFEQGYQMDERIIRFAKVQVGKKE